MSPEVAAEAAVWIARLHGPDRSAQMERECLAWQASSAERRLAFERCTDVWQDVAGLTLSSHVAASTARRPDGPIGRIYTRRAVLASAVLGGAVLFAWRFWPGGQSYETGVGERRTVLLTDGSRMTLNTSTEVNVALTKSRRKVGVLRGEALFEVAKDPTRPFVVRTAGAEVVATGTEFLVRAPIAGASETSTADITLIEGQVVVRDAAGGAGGLMTTPVVMEPGERLRFQPAGATPAPGASAPISRDRPRMEQLLAWRRGEVVFEEVLLSEALAEMGRYSRLPIILANADTLGGLRISGVYRVGDIAGFARAVAKLHGLAVRIDADRVELSPS